MSLFSEQALESNGSEEGVEAIILIVVLVSSIWVLIDAKSLGVKTGS